MLQHFNKIKVHGVPIIQNSYYAFITEEGEVHQLYVVRLLETKYHNNNNNNNGRNGSF